MLIVLRPFPETANGVGASPIILKLLVQRIYRCAFQEVLKATWHVPAPCDPASGTLPPSFRASNAILVQLEADADYLRATQGNPSYKSAHWEIVSHAAL